MHLLAHTRSCGSDSKRAHSKAPRCRAGSKALHSRLERLRKSPETPPDSLGIWRCLLGTRSLRNLLTALPRAWPFAASDIVQKQLRAAFQYKIDAALHDLYTHIIMAVTEPEIGTDREGKDVSDSARTAILWLTYCRWLVTVREHPYPVDC